MNDPFSQRVRDCFASVRALKREDQLAWFAQHSVDSKVRREVEELLAVDRDDSFLESPIDPSAFGVDRLVDAMPFHEINSDAKIGSHANSPEAETASFELSSRPTGGSSSLLGGKYKLLQKIGEGGFGVVYMAEQSAPVRRRVAVKLLKPGMDSKSILARFDAERQALALMDHPSIARVFDGGLTEAGQPYFVMELVSGETITDYCRDHRVTISQRMELLAEVCKAIQHAHQKGVIHRDIKPSNILVQELDGKLLPKVIDFGIAKAIHGPLTNQTIFTEFRQMIGTLEYMSPEQTQTSNNDIDTRSDVYALGIVAYELLTGTTPLDGPSLRKLALAEIQRTIVETESPRPSTRLASLESSHQQKATSRQHGSAQAIAKPSSDLPSKLDHDLDWIVMKAIEKDRQRRYPTALALAEELKRWLDGEPIQARPPSVRYRLSKWVRKHRAQAMLVVTIGLATLLSMASLGFGVAQRKFALESQSLRLIETKQANQIAEMEKERAESLHYGNAMIAAAESFTTGRKKTTWHLLNATPSSRRGIEWEWLEHLASDRSIRLPANPKGAARSVRFSADSQLVASVGEDGFLHQWKVSTGELRRSWKASDEPLTQVEFSSLQRLVFTGNTKGVVDAWDEMGKKLASTQLDGAITHLSLLDQGKLLAAGASNGDVLFLDPHSLEPTLRIVPATPRFRGKILSIEFDPIRNIFIIAGRGGIRIVDRATGTLQAELGNYWQTYRVALTENKDQIVTAGPPMVLWSLETKEKLREWNPPSSEIVAASFLSSKNRFVFVTDDQAIRSLDMMTGDQETIGYCEDGDINDIAIASNGESLAFASDDGSTHLWHHQRFSMATILADQGPIAQIGNLPDGDVIALTSRGRVLRWDRETNSVTWSIDAYEQQGFSVASSYNSSFVMTAGIPANVRIWNLRDGETPTVFPMSWGVRFAAIHPNGKWFAGPMSSDTKDYSLPNSESQKFDPKEGDIALWDAESKKIIRKFSGLKNWSLGLSFSSTGNLLATTSVENAVVVWNVSTAERLTYIPLENLTPKQVCFDENEERLFIGCSDGQVLVWNLAQNQIDQSLVCHGDEISKLLLIDNGNRLITTSINDSRVRVWDWIAGQKVMELESGLSGISDLITNPQGTELMMAGSDKGIRIFRIASD